MSDKPADSEFGNKKNIMWVLLSGAMAITFIVLMFLPDSGTGTGMIAVYASMLWCGLFGAALGRYFNKNGWIGFAIGSVVGLVIQMLSQLV
ncbi:hypothetical protein [Alteromonas sp. H39]|uniref:hypothetical protein n=1 Tax=Alteromonas sp. H39 TaxID=3389876 RepID=UPI0039E18118